MGVSISPDVPSSPATSGGVSSATGTVDAATEATSNTSAGSGSSTSGSGSSNSASGGSPSGSSDKNGLSPAELAGIIIGAVGSVAGVAAVWVGIKQLKNKRHGRDASEAAQGFLSENQPRNTIHIAPTFNMPTTPQYNPIPPPYHSGYIYGRSA
ncbi:uncharacterized protein B0T15DRAFT_540833 [Chaetomium strumarium]|uniref:Uncharacterized protein n=1 Tax=Chaetomium strumarium TaxID=1170767 RepID=A0AAJ0LZQ5_9PEZI|nr:hypothetical protein B0T15DRAFT_540833 [Chaetomium strumarium]